MLRTAWSRPYNFGVGLRRARFRKSSILTGDWVGFAVAEVLWSCYAKHSAGAVINAKLGSGTSCRSLDID